MRKRKTDDRMRIVLLTNRDKMRLIKNLLNANEKIIAVILPAVSKRDSELKPVVDLAAKEGIPVFRLKRRELGRRLRSLSPDVLLSVAYPYLLTSEQLRVAQYSINVHPALLPKYRGPATAWHIIANGERETGVTVHSIDEGMDTGPILVQLKTRLSIFDTLKSAMRKALNLEPRAVKMALKALRKGRLKFLAQDEKLATTFPGIRTPEDSKIDPRRSVLELYNFIRACDPKRFPAFFELQGEKIGIRFLRMRPKRKRENLKQKKWI